MIVRPPLEYVKWSEPLKGQIWHKSDRAPEGWLGAAIGRPWPCRWSNAGQKALPLRTVLAERPKRWLFGTKRHRAPEGWLAGTAGRPCRWSACWDQWSSTRMLACVAVTRRPLEQLPRAAIAKGLILAPCSSHSVQFWLFPQKLPGAAADGCDCQTAKRWPALRVQQ